ncbi:MAG TPA: acyl-CoA dehydrogenase family protein, partial [Streptosporangiaceae bacterium]
MNDGKEELDELREAVRAFLAAKSPESAVRAAMETGYDLPAWDQMARQLRLPGLALPGDYGGDGFGLTELEVVLEEMGAALLCSPFFATVVLAAQALLASGDEAACSRHLPGIAAGRTTATLAAAEGNASWDPAMVTARAERTPEGWVLTGT